MVYVVDVDGDGVGAIAFRLRPTRSRVHGIAYVFKTQKCEVFDAQLRTIS